MGKVIQVWMGRCGVVGGVVVKAAGVWGVVCMRMEHLGQNKENFEYKVKLKSG